jgi:hypothetical protein
MPCEEKQLKSAHNAAAQRMHNRCGWPGAWGPCDHGVAPPCHLKNMPAEERTNAAAQWMHLAVTGQWHGDPAIRELHPHAT